MHDNVEFHPEARTDIETISREIAAYSEQVLDRFWEDLERQIAKISQFPGVGHPDPTGFRRLNLRRYPYHILYEEYSMESVRIMVVRHDRRHETYGADRK